jgi:hypothetical protein
VTILDKTDKFSDHIKKSMQKREDLHFSKLVINQAENMSSIESNSMDAVVHTFFLCSVENSDLVLNEILYDPSNSALDGDANGDGVYAHNQDEFIELINNSSKPVDLSGFKVFDASGLAANNPNHTIPAGTIIQPQKALLIFGGGTPTGTFGGATIQKSTSGDMNLNNAGDMLTIQDAAGNTIISFDITPLSDNPNESYTRNPDILGNFEQHTVSTSKKFSPGTKINGDTF